MTIEPFGVAERAGSRGHPGVLLLSRRRDASCEQAQQACRACTIHFDDHFRPRGKSPTALLQASRRVHISAPDHGAYTEQGGVHLQLAWQRRAAHPAPWCLVPALTASRSTTASPRVLIWRMRTRTGRDEGGKDSRTHRDPKPRGRSRALTRPQRRRARAMPGSVQRRVQLQDLGTATAATAVLRGRISTKMPRGKRRKTMHPRSGARRLTCPSTRRAPLTPAHVEQGPPPRASERDGI